MLLRLLHGIGVGDGGRAGEAKACEESKKLKHKMSTPFAFRRNGFSFHHKLEMWWIVEWRLHDVPHAV